VTVQDVARACADHLRAWAGRLGGSRSARLGTADTHGALVYAVGDVHGRYDLLSDLLARIASDAETRAAGRRPVLVLCGDYIDRGPQSVEVVEALVRLQRSDRFDLRPLRGNHEQALLDFLDDPATGPGWLRNGGDATLRAYGAPLPLVDDGAEGLRASRDALLARLPATHLALLRALPLATTVGDYIFVHAGLRPGKRLEDQHPEDLLWIRDDFLRARKPFEHVVVHGHSWTSDVPQLLDHRIGLDTGAFITGVLTAVRLDGADHEILQATAADPADPWAMRGSPPLRV